MEKRLTAPNLAELYRLAAETYQDLPAFATRRRALEWHPVTFRELYESGLSLATALISLGVAARDHIGLFGDNRFEWILADYGTLLCGAADVPRGRDVTDAEMIYIVNHAGLRVAFVETQALQEKILRLRPRMPDLREVILLDPLADAAPGVHRLSDLLARGAAARAAGDREAEARIAKIAPDDLFTLIYTSGTTGEPKGVMLTHANMISQLETIPIEVGWNDRILSILPVWHIFERVFEMLAISRGACTYYSSIRGLAEDLANVEPTFMGSAPRLWESLHQRILKNIRQAHPVRRGLFHIAHFLGRHYQESVFHLTGRELRTGCQPVWRRRLLQLYHALQWLVLLPWYGFFNAAVLERIRQAAGGSLKATVSGGGALPAEIDRFFNAIGIPVLEGYGLTETAPVLAVRTHRELVVGTVGPLIAGTKMCIADPDTDEIIFPNPSRPHDGRGLRGEIRVRGPQVMRGYYRDAEATRRAMRNGWFHTGDLGMMTFNDCLKILGRCKETIVLLSGENLEPGPIEMRLRQSLLIDQCMVVGQDQKYIAALVVADLDAFRERGFAAASLAELNRDPQVQRLIREEIRHQISTASGFKNFEHIHDFRLLPETFRIGEEITNLHKLRRHVIEAKYAEEIASLFHPRHGN